MNPERWHRLKSIFEDALDQPVAARREWIRQACGDDHELRQDAIALLRSHETAGGFLESPPDFDPDLDPDFDTLEDGTSLGSFRIVRRIGRGGMGVVYLADDLELGRQVALKALPSFLASNSELRERLRREARAAATIKHPSIATVYSLQEIDGHLFIVSEYVEGTTLRARLDNGPLDASHARAVAVKIASALAAAHAAGVVHRDLKPENVIITPGGEIKVVDFGIAHIDEPESARLTKQGVALGTPGYMPPEQRLGGAVDARVDVFAFGILFAEMLLGRRPTTPEDHALIPSRFGTLIATCVRSNPDARYASGDELLHALSGESPATEAVRGVRLQPGPGTPAVRGVRLASPAEARNERRPQADLESEAASARWWWEFHQAAVAVVYGVMTWPAWIARQIVGGSAGRALFIAVLTAVVVAATLRLHLWFTSRFYPGELQSARRRAGPWIRAADWVFVASLGLSGVFVGDDRSPVAIVLVAVAVGAAMAFLVIERGTSRAAFPATRVSD